MRTDELLQQLKNREASIAKLYDDKFRLQELRSAAERLIYLLCGDQEDEEEIDRGIGVPGAGYAINRLREAIGKEEKD